MGTEIRAITGENELLEFLPVIIKSFSTVADEMKLTKDNAPTNPAFITSGRLLDIYKNIKCFGLYYDNAPIGFFGFEGSEDSVLMLEKLAVLPDFRHRGYGKKILEYAVNYASGLSFSKISIAIINENRVLKKWYEAFGFTEVRINIFPHLPFEVCFMELLIDSGKN